MKLIITQATVCDPQSAYHGKRCDVFLQNGLIQEISPSGKMKQSGVKVMNATGQTLSPGFVDMRASLRDPGFEQKETLDSAARAAAAGGFTTLACLPNTQPTVQTKADIEFILRKADSLPVHILPYGAITHNREGAEMNELYDMHQAGAIGFTDGNKTIMQAGIMERAMQYTTIFNSLILAHAEDASIAGSGMMHEGEVSTRLGLKGIPNIAEELIVNRDIELARYTQARIHISHISSKGSVELIRKARKAKLPVTCDVSVANLIWTDTELEDFNSHFKLTPPLRSKQDQKALWDGLADGTIDCIVSDHAPEDPERKDLEFEYAAQGMIQLQTVFPLLNMYAPKTISQDILIKALTSAPRRILRLPEVSINKGSIAELCLYDTKASWNYTPKNNLSRSSNSPLLGQTLKGKIIATFNKDQINKYA
ncbi:MAG: dihydroorotase [Bacteroidia bacterium]|jgi:dihydroorotase